MLREGGASSTLCGNYLGCAVAANPAITGSSAGACHRAGPFGPDPLANDDSAGYLNACNEQLITLPLNSFGTSPTRPAASRMNKRSSPAGALRCRGRHRGRGGAHRSGWRTAGSARRSQSPSPWCRSGASADICSSTFTVPGSFRAAPHRRSLQPGRRRPSSARSKRPSPRSDESHARRRRQARCDRR